MSTKSNNLSVQVIDPEGSSLIVDRLTVDQVFEVVGDKSWKKGTLLLVWHGGKKVARYAVGPRGLVKARRAA